jgi:hypothetical protein
MLNPFSIAEKVNLFNLGGKSLILTETEYSQNREIHVVSTVGEPKRAPLAAGGD